MTKEERLISALIGLVRAAEGNEDLITAETDRLIIDSLATLHESALDERVFEYLMKEVKREKGRLAPSCQFCAMPCGRTGDYDMSNLLDNSSEIRNAKGRILSLVERLAKEDGKSRGKPALAGCFLKPNPCNKSHIWKKTGHTNCVPCLFGRSDGT